MPALSPLATLIATLTEVCHHAQAHSSLLSKNEAATRAALIDPVLRALGWDTANLGQVVPEYTIGSAQRPDYFLKHRDGATQYVLEAKKLGEDLDKMGHTGKLIGYAFSLKPVAFFVTDGLSWHCYLPTHSQYEPFAIIRLTAEELLPAALQLLQLLDAAHAGHGLPKSAGNEVANPVQPVTTPPIPLPTGGKSILTTSNSAAKPQNPVALPPPGTAHPGKSYRKLTHDLADPDQALGKPTWLRLPDGSEHPLKSWKDILIAACQLVLETKLDLILPLPDKAGKKTALLRWERPKRGLSHTATIYQGKPAFIYTNYSAADCVRNALYVLHSLPKSKPLSKCSIAFAD